MSDIATSNITIQPSTDATVLTWTLSVASPTPTPPPPPPPAAKMLIGTNVANNKTDTGDANWADITNRMTGWYPNGSTKQSDITYDANGYVASVANGGQAAAHTFIIGYPSGTYKVAWKGAANALSIVGKTLANITGDEAGGYTATVQLDSGQWVKLLTSGGITKLSIFAPDANPGQVYRDAYLNTLRPYAVIRLMDLQQTNGVGLPSVVRNVWANRVLPTQWGAQTQYEVALENCLELCKEAGTIPWVNLPYNADDAFINGAATMVKQYGFTAAYFEYGNELWNTGPVYQGNQIRTDGIAAGLATDPNVAGARLAAKLTARAGKMIKAIFPAAKIVYGGQAVWDAWASDGLHSLQPGDVDVLAVAPYFGPVGGDDVSTVQKLHDSCLKWINTALAQGLQANAAVAKSYGCDYVAYEGGQSLEDVVVTKAPSNELQWNAELNQADFNTYLTDPARAIQTDPLMGDLYDAMFAVSKAAGITLFNHFMSISNWGRFGFWGLRQQLTDPSNPKSDAVNRAIAAGNNVTKL